jgi:hypothetical protein
MMGFAAAAFGWSPQVFWSSTAHEYFATYEVWLKLNPRQDQD